MADPSSDWRWRWYYSTPAKDHYVIARVWGNKAVDRVIVGDDTLELAVGDTEQAIREFVQKRLPSPEP
jgi:hypothetical protein